MKQTTAIHAIASAEIEFKAAKKNKDGSYNCRATGRIFSVLVMELKALGQSETDARCTAQALRWMICKN